MQPFIDAMPTIQDFYLKAHQDERVHLPCSYCTTANAKGKNVTFRCKDCFLHPPSCQSCFLDLHRYLPFHHIEEWNGQYFEQRCLQDISFVFYPRHFGTRCPNRASDSSPRPLTICASNGIHEVLVLYCMCQGSGTHSDQLFNCQFFPATLADPKSCFTFELLNQYHIHSCVSKKAAYDYFRALLHLTDNILPKQQPVSLSLLAWI